MKKILFVCLGNICRSPTAEAVFAQKADQAGVEVETDSAGTGGWHVGEPPYPPMIEEASKSGYDLTPLRARQFVKSDFTQFDLIVVMDDNNLRDVERLRPHGNMTPVARMVDYGTQTKAAEVPDPYYTRDFRETLGIVEDAADGLVAALKG